MSSDPKQLLFKDKIADDGKPLFASQTELARKIIAIEGGGFDIDRSENSVRVYLSQVLKPSGDKNSRPPSDNLVDCLKTAISARIDDADKATNVSDKIISAIYSLKDLSLQERPSNSNDEWQTMLKHAATKEQVVVITQTPAENEENDKDHASRLVKILIDRTIDPDKENKKKPLSFTFFITNHFAARKMRNSLIRTVRKTCVKAEDDNEKAQKIVETAEEEGRFKIYWLSSKCFLPPMCVFNPDCEGMSGFHLYYHTKNHVSVSRLDKKTLQDWGEKFYVNLKYESNGTKIVPIGKTKPFKTEKE